MSDQQIEHLLFLKREQLLTQYKIASKNTEEAITLFANFWFFSMIVSFGGIGLIVSNISQAIGVFLTILFGPTAIICLVIALLSQITFSKDQKKYVDKQMEFVRKEFESASLLTQQTEVKE